MVNYDIVGQIKKLEIQTKKILQGSFSGHKRSIIKGYGLDFDQLRDYQYGDDIRAIDWNSSARSQKILIKQYYEERNRTVFLVIDRSASMFYGANQDKWDVVAQAASILALVAHYGHDKIGLILFDETIEIINPKKGMAHLHYLIKKLYQQKPTMHSTNTLRVIEYLTKLNRKDSIIFLLTDALDQYEPYIHLFKKYEYVIFRCLDSLEQMLPTGFMAPTIDVEKGTFGFINTHKDSGVNNFLGQRIKEQNEIFKKYGVTYLDLKNSESSVNDIIRFLQQRMVY